MKTLVLPGGGACGRWQAGKVQQLLEKGYVFDMICGTSVGGLNTLVIAAGFSMKDLWALITKNSDVYTGMLQFNNFFDFIGMAGQIFKSNKSKSILRPDGLYKILEKTFGNMKMKDLKIPVKITATDMISGERVIFSKETYPDVLVSYVAKCTSAIPLAFPSVEGPSALYCDGGLGRNNPVDVAIDSGASEIVLVGTMPDCYPPKNVKNNVIEIAMRMQDIIMHIFEEECWESKDAHPEIKITDYYPKESTGSALKFDNVEQWDKGYNF